MCWYVYIATSAPIEPLVWRLNPEEGPPPLLHFELIAEDADLRDNQLRTLFEMPHLYYVGSSSGCSCDFAAGNEYDYYTNEIIRLNASESAKALVDFIQEYTRREPLEMYIVWEVAWNDGTAPQPIKYSTLGAGTLNDENPVALVSRHFYVFYDEQVQPVLDTPRFLNVDLDVVGTFEGIAALLRHWDNHVATLNTPDETGEPAARIELATSYPNAAETIAQFCALVDELPPALREVWDLCLSRVLNIGYDSGQQRPALVEALPATLLARVAQSFSALEITIYPL